MERIQWHHGLLLLIVSNCFPRHLSLKVVLLAERFANKKYSIIFVLTPGMLRIISPDFRCTTIMIFLCWQLETSRWFPESSSMFCFSATAFPSICLQLGSDGSGWENKYFIVSFVRREYSGWQLSHFCNRTVHTCTHFCYKMMYVGEWDWDFLDWSIDVHHCFKRFIKLVRNSILGYWVWINHFFVHIFEDTSTHSC